MVKLGVKCAYAEWWARYAVSREIKKVHSGSIEYGANFMGAAIGWYVLYFYTSSATSRRQ